VQGVSLAIHLAAVFCTADAGESGRPIRGTRNLIAAMKAHAPDARFIMASTTHVYAADSPRPA
jgi:hypothetical protein